MISLAAGGANADGSVLVFAGTALALVSFGYVLWPLVRGASSANSSTRNRDTIFSDMASLNSQPDASADDEAEQLIARARARQRECPTCGPRPQPDAKFCSNCGQAIPGVCQHCGAKLHATGAPFCSECGAKQ